MRSKERPENVDRSAAGADVAASPWESVLGGAGASDLSPGRPGAEKMGGRQARKRFNEGGGDAGGAAAPDGAVVVGGAGVDSGGRQQRKRVNIEEPLRCLVRASAGNQPWCLQARPSGDLGKLTSPDTQSLIYCPLIANIVGSDSTHPLAITRMQMDAVERFWTEIFPPWREWVLEYSAAGVISSITLASFDARRKMSLVPDTTSEVHATAGNGPYFLAGAQTQILGHLPATLAGVEAYVQTFWSSMRPHPEANACGRGGGGGLASGGGAASGGGT
jgi:hypothetical protein